MRELFLNILTASIHGSIIIMVILLLRPILKKAPKNTLCLLWLLAALRLLLPFEIQSSFSLQPELDAVAIPGAEYAEQMTSGFQSSTQDVFLPPMEMEDIPVQAPDIENTQQPVDDAVIYEIDVPLKVKILENYEQILVWLWAAGAAMLLTYSAVAYGLLKHRIRGSVVLSEGVWACGRVESAFVLGFFRPQIYLSANLPENARDYVLAHEKCHIRRGDHWWKLLGYLTLAIHWFNPLVWLAYSLLCRDLEMACDEAVVKTMSVEERKSYSAALLTCSVRGARIAACPVAFGEVSVKQRIKNVLHYRKPGFWITIMALVLVAVVAVCFLTSPENAPDLSFLNYENAISTVADQDKVMTIYCDEDSIIPCQVDGNAFGKYLDHARWTRRRWEPRDQSSPGSIEFVISDDYRITIFDRNFAKVTYCEDVRYYRISRSDYEQALELIDVAKYVELTWNLEVNAVNVTPTGLTFTFIQHGPFAEGDRASLMYGSEYTLQVRNGQNWEEVPMVPHEYEIAWTMEAYLIEQGKTTHQKIDWQWLYGTLSAGEYRIGKTVSLDRASGDSETHTFWAEFTIPALNQDQEKQLVDQCRDAMVELKKAEELWLYVAPLDGRPDKNNVFMRAGDEWMFKYRVPSMDYETVKWFFYNGEQYLYDEVTDEQGNVLEPYRWQIDPEPENHEFFLPYPFDLDWGRIGLVFQGRSEEYSVECITVSFPEYLDVFAFYFLNGELLYFNVGDQNGDQVEFDSQFFVDYPGDDTVAEHLAAQYAEVTAKIDAPPIVRDEAFYEELFTRRTDGAYTTQLQYELFVAFYREPEEFSRQLYRKYTQNPEDVQRVLMLMSNEIEFAAPVRFMDTIAKLRSNPNVNQTIVDMLEECFPYES